MLLLSFELGGDRYALDCHAVVEVLPLLDVRAVPRSPPGVVGVIDYRGATVPVIDLSQLALGRPAARRMSTRIIVVDHADTRGTERRVGLIAERATQTLRCDPEQFAPAGLSRAGAPYLGAMAALPSGLVQRVEVDALLTPALCAAFFESSPEL